MLGQGRSSGDGPNLMRVIYIITCVNYGIWVSKRTHLERISIFIQDSWRVHESFTLLFCSGVYLLY